MQPQTPSPPPNAAARAYVPRRYVGTDHRPEIRCTCTPNAAEACPVPHNIWLDPGGDHR